MTHLKLIFLIHVVVFQSNFNEAKIQVSDVKMCSDKNYPFNLKDIAVRPVGDDLELKMKVNLAMDIDNDNYYRVVVEKIIGNKLKSIINVKQKGACSGLMSYGGEVYFKGAKQAKIPNYEKCPIAKGHYTLNWYRIDVAAIPLLKLVPQGKFKCSLMMFKSAADDELFCVQFVAEKN